MPLFVITGKRGCPNHTHALFVADYLTKQLPSFRYIAIDKSEEDWPAWLNELNNNNKWYQTKSPVIWKEINKRGGKKYLIGGLSEFWEYCYDYYGFQSRISKRDLDKIIADNNLIASKEETLSDRVICIIGALNEMLGLLIHQLQDCFPQGRDTRVFLRLYDKDLYDAEKAEFLLEVVEEIQPALKWRPQSISIVQTLDAALRNCDLLLVIEDYSRNPLEKADAWYNRCRNGMHLLAEEINTYAKRSLRVVLSHLGPICFNASILVEHCTTIRLANIVAVTADEGMATIQMAADRIEDSVENFGCPPVWGLSGTLSFIDVGNTIVKGEVYRPYKRTLTRKDTSKLPKGIIVPELRLLSDMIKFEDPLYKDVEAKRKSMMTKRSDWVKIRATTSLLKLWFADEPSDDLISLGVCSNGSFGFPAGVVFSQIVIQNEQRLWEPVSNFPLVEKTARRIGEIVLDVADTLKRYGIRDLLV